MGLSKLVVMLNFLITDGFYEFIFQRRKSVYVTIIVSIVDCRKRFIIIRCMLIKKINILDYVVFYCLLAFDSCL
jgi:hypothetical protein